MIMHPTQLNYPFPNVINPKADEIEAKTTEWINEYTVFPESMREKFKAARFGKLAAYFHPEAPFERLIPMSRWNLWIFLFDDYYGPYPIEELTRACKYVIEILKGVPPAATDSALFRQPALIRKELLSFVTEEWMDRFIRDMNGFFHTMLTATEYSYKDPVNYPLLNDYLIIREDLIGVYPTVDLAEITGTALLTNEVLGTPVIKQLRKLTSLIVALSNDIFSVRKDYEEKEAMNAVLIIQHEQQCTMDSAYAETVRLHNEFTAEFVHTCNHLPHFGQQDKTVRRYVENLSHIIQGHLSWYKYSGRY